MHFSMFAIVDEKVYKRLKCVSIKTTHIDMQKCIWPKKIGKGMKEWIKVSIDFGTPPRKLNILVKTKHYEIIQNDQTFA